MAAPQTFGRYRVTGTLGRGAMGEVHAAVDEVLGREVAIKTLHGGASGLAARLLDERFKQEARAIASFTHPHVVQVFDIDLAAEPPYLVMERVSGPSLKERLAERSLSERELRALGIQIANALAAAHAAGVVHRDVKPANILIAGEGTWKLADFGVAHVPDSSLTMTGQFVGSPAYAPPEALLRGQLGPAGDIYGLGATLYQAISGRWPRAEGTSGALLGPVPPIAELVPAMSPQVAEVIDRAVAIEPDQRPSAADFASALARANTQPVIAAVPLVSDPARLATPVPFAAPVETQFVSSTPGTTAYAQGAGGTGTSGPLATGPGAGSESRHLHLGPGAALVGLPAASRPPIAWQRWALIAATLAVVIALVITRRAPSPPSPSRNASPFTLPTAQTPTTINAARPPIPDQEAANDWAEIVENLQEHDFAEARERLDEFESRYGQSNETRSLASQLDQLPLEEREPRRKKHKWKR